MNAKSGLFCAILGLPLLPGAVAVSAEPKAGASSASTQSGASDWQDKLRRPPAERNVSKPLFWSKDWSPPLPPSAKTEPTVPPFPFQFVGTLLESGRPPVLYLTKSGRLYPVSAGDVLENTYRVDRIGKDFVEITYLPLNKVHTATFTSIAAPRRSEGSTYTPATASTGLFQPSTSAEASTFAPIGENQAPVAHEDATAAARPIVRGAATQTTLTTAAVAGLPAEPTGKHVVETSAHPLNTSGGAMVILPPILKEMPLLPPTSDMPVLAPSNTPMAILPPSGTMQMTPPESTSMTVVPAPR